MRTDEIIQKVRDSLNIPDDSKDIIISDVIQDALNYCHRPDLPTELESYIRKKVRGIINYEAENGTATVFDVQSIKEGDTSTTYNTNTVSRETIYGLSSGDMRTLRNFRRLG